MQLEESGGEGGPTLPPDFLKGSFYKGVAAISFTAARFQFRQMKHYEVARSPSKSQMWRKTEARAQFREIFPDHRLARNPTVEQQTVTVGRAGQFRPSKKNVRFHAFQTSKV